jgi:hypothetical protein
VPLPVVAHAAFRHYLFDHLVGAGEQHRRHDEAEHPGVCAVMTRTWRQ